MGMHTHDQQETFLLEGSSHQRPTLDTTQMCTESGILVCSHSGIGGERVETDCTNTVQGRSRVCTRTCHVDLLAQQSEAGD